MSRNLNSTQGGATTLILTVILMVAALFIMLYMSSHSVMQQKTVTNQYISDQAYDAAEAGVEFGIAYLRQNKTTILANPVSGYISYGPSDTSITNVTQANNTRFSIVYTNPTANNYDLILITATGTSTDNTTTKTIRQLVQYRPLLMTPPTNPSNVLGTASIQGNARVTNNEGNTSIIAGSTISYLGNGKSTSTTGSSSTSGHGSDVQQNAPSLSGLTAEQFFQSYYGIPASAVKTMFANYFLGSSSPSLSGLTNTTIWVDGDFTIANNTTVGSLTAPVLMVVNGNYVMNGNVTIYGFLFVFGTVTSNNGTPQVIGSFAASGNLSLQGNPDIIYNSSVLNAASSNTGIYARVPGSWRDY